MKKRNTIVLSSSDDEVKDPLRNSNSSHSKSKSTSSVRRTTNPRKPKKPCTPDSRSRLNTDSGNVIGGRLLWEDIDEGFTGIKVSTAETRWKHKSGSQRSTMEELWVNKYKPRSLEELAVHKKKVEEVRLWFEDRLRSSKEEFLNHVLIITGQAGIGKSATVQVIASHLGARLCEWNTPTPTIWQEHLHNCNPGMHYTSKLDEFENFAERIRKYGMISLSSSGDSKSSIILLIDDLPVANGKVASGRLYNCLHLLVRSIQIPTVILITDYGKADSADNSARWLEELQSSLESVGACKVTFNPITTISIKKTLSRICRQENCNADSEQIDLIAKASGGDIRHAITSLQYFCLKPDPMLSLSFSNPTSTYSKEKSDHVKTWDDGFSLPFARDETLSLFHALGKFLHNKRETECAVALDQDAFLVSDKFTRLPLKMDAPEKVLCQAHGQARPIADFLHENVLDFLGEEAIDDAWAVASYLSDSDFLIATLRGMIARNYEAESVVQSAAASVAVRGVLYGNSHPSPSRWHSIRRPKLWQVEQSSLHNKIEMVKQRYIACNGVWISDLSSIATEYTPVLKWLGYREPGDLKGRQVLTRGNETETDNDNFDSMSLDEQESEISEDEIEDW